MRQNKTCLIRFNAWVGNSVTDMWANRNGETVRQALVFCMSLIPPKKTDLGFQTRLELNGLAHVQKIVRDLKFHF